ncbi:hypothetical protein LC087_18090 [Bacillus carboniphilus]|uniref:Lipoprotein n=1 Tax=Bacillus carboniphilus TaxID=86663 RepID=A0ABY9JUV7_9BACI|nr:hypothetical protein [Bacillus carboniphilus]WLR42569.1 hypothetical protein LC087_18090 [Bacillus carboniphilus]
MKKHLVILVTVILMVLMGCTFESTEDNVIDNNSNDFSYLRDLTENDHKAYELFIEEKYSKHLSGVSPEKIVLIYFQSVVMNDIEAIYALTYETDNQVDFITFENNYNRGD